MRLNIFHWNSIIDTICPLSMIFKFLKDIQFCEILDNEALFLTLFIEEIDIKSLSVVFYIMI